MKGFLFVLLFYFSSFASSDVDWGLVINNCLSSQNNNLYCKDLRNYEAQIDSKFNLILANNTSPLQRDVLSLVYYFAKDNISLTWTLKKNYKLNISHQISTEYLKIILNYNF